MHVIPMKGNMSVRQTAGGDSAGASLFGANVLAVAVQLHGEQSRTLHLRDGSGCFG